MSAKLSRGKRDYREPIANIVNDRRAQNRRSKRPLTSAATGLLIGERRDVHAVSPKRSTDGEIPKPSAISAALSEGSCSNARNRWTGGRWARDIGTTKS